MTDEDRARAALAKLQGVLSDVASSMVERIHERCPYRARDEQCTFAGGCRNQRRSESHEGGEARQRWCGGDHLLRRTES